MPNIFKPKRSTTAGNVPNLSNLADGELAVNIADQKIYVRSGFSIVTVADVGSSNNGNNGNVTTAYINLDGGAPNSNYGGIANIDVGRVS
jgi:hypothetical protein